MKGKPYIDATWDRPAPAPRIIHMTVTGLDLDRAIPFHTTQSARSCTCLISQAGKRRFPGKEVVSAFTWMRVGPAEDKVKFNFDPLGEELVALFDARQFDTIKGMLPCQVTLTPRDERLYR